VVFYTINPAENAAKDVCFVLFCVFGYETALFFSKRVAARRPHAQKIAQAQFYWR
jgi:hypothetical protein